MLKGLMEGYAGSNPAPNETFEEVLHRRVRRCRLLKGALASAPLIVVGASRGGQGQQAAAESDASLTFQPVKLNAEDRVIVSAGYSAQVLIRWGDPLHLNVPELSIAHQTAERQAQQFGYNCDSWRTFPCRIILPTTRAAASWRSTTNTPMQRSCFSTMCLAALLGGRWTSKSPHMGWPLSRWCTCPREAGDTKSLRTSTVASQVKPTYSSPAPAPAMTGPRCRSLVSPISSPTNITFDQQGNLWISTDGQTAAFQKNDGVYAVPVEGRERGYVRQLLSGVPGGETASLTFTPNNHALLVSIQHPGEGSSLRQPSSTWPDGTIPPRPSVLVVEKTGDDSRVIGS
jgi:secreted PhoX family phosphatase